MPVTMENLWLEFVSCCQWIQSWDKIHREPSFSSSAAHSSTCFIDYLIIFNIFATYSILWFVFFWLSISSIWSLVFFWNLLIPSYTCRGKKNLKNWRISLCFSWWRSPKAKDSLNFLVSRLKQCSSKLTSNAVVIKANWIL